MNSTPGTRSHALKDIALRHGFMGAGISKAEFMEEEAIRLEKWLSKGYHGEMGYMANHFDLRVDPSKLVPGAKSIISLIYNYFPGDDIESGDILSTEENFKISKYARGNDYHNVVRRKLKLLLQDVKKEFGDFHARVFVDSAPVMERDWAKRSGLGWIGKNTLLINTKKGSFFFLAEIILDVEFEYDQPIRDHCGTCTRCIDACPTDAISPDGYVLDGSKCISYLTIELKTQIPEEFKGKMENWIFGCDICQDVCPWNRFSSSHAEPAFIPETDTQHFTKREWQEITEDVFEKIFSKTPVMRAGYEKLKNTILFQS